MVTEFISYDQGSGGTEHHHQQRHHYDEWEVSGYGMYLLKGLTAAQAP